MSSSHCLLTAVRIGVRLLFGRHAGAADGVGNGAHHLEEGTEPRDRCFALYQVTETNKRNPWCLSLRAASRRRTR